jgi:hypothetical protein
MKIKSIYGNILFESTKKTIKETLVQAVIRGADLRGADLKYADLVGADISMYSKWLFSFKNDKLRIGCKTNTIKRWDKFFKSNEEFETPRRTKEFKQIEAMYLAHKTYYEFLNK